jgi:hypothetical protein
MDTTVSTNKAFNDFVKIGYELAMKDVEIAQLTDKPVLPYLQKQLEQM